LLIVDCGYKPLWFLAQVTLSLNLRQQRNYFLSPSAKADGNSPLFLPTSASFHPLSRSLFSYLRLGGSAIRRRKEDRDLRSRKRINFTESNPSPVPGTPLHLKGRLCTCKIPANRQIQSFSR